MSDDIDYEYYRLQRVTIEKPRPNRMVIRTAAVHSCSTCGRIIAGMGGPGDGDICIPCGDAIRHQQAVGCIKWEDKA